MELLIISASFVFFGVFLGVLFGAHPSQADEDQFLGWLAAALMIAGAIGLTGSIVAFLVGVIS